MSKIKKENNDHLNDFKTDWEIFPWNKAMYDKHDKDFREILAEYQDLRQVYNDPSMARWRWIEKKGGLVMRFDELGKIYPSVIPEKYANFSDMFARFEDWLSFQEKNSMSSESRAEQIRNIFTGTKKPTFEIPKIIQKEIEGFEGI